MLAVLTDKSQPSRWSGEGTEAYRQLSAGLHLTTMGRGLPQLSTVFTFEIGSTETDFWSNWSATGKSR